MNLKIKNHFICWTIPFTKRKKWIFRKYNRFWRKMTSSLFKDSHFCSKITFLNIIYQFDRNFRPNFCSNISWKHSVFTKNVFMHIFKLSFSEYTVENSNFDTKFRFPISEFFEFRSKLDPFVINTGFNIKFRFTSGQSQIISNQKLNKLKSFVVNQFQPVKCVWQKHQKQQMLISEEIMLKLISVSFLKLVTVILVTFWCCWQNKIEKMSMTESK